MVKRLSLSKIFLPVSRNLFKISKMRVKFFLKLAPSVVKNYYPIRTKDTKNVLSDLIFHDLKLHKNKKDIKKTNGTLDPYASNND